MKAIKINTQSWHYKFVCSIGDTPEDICAYTRRLVWAAFILSLGCIVGGVILWGVGDAIGWMVVCAVNLIIFTPEPQAIVSLLFMGVFSLIALCVWLKIYTEENEPGFVRTAWGHFHEKTCAKLEFDEA